MTQDELLAKIDEPNPIGYITTKLSTELAMRTEDYLLTAYQSVGINPKIIIEQNALINQLKAQIRAVVELKVPTTFGTDVSTHTAWLDGYNYRKEQDLQAIEGEVK